MYQIPNKTHEKMKTKAKNDNKYLTVEWDPDTNEIKFLCYTLEDEHREDKIMSETRIPAGTYKLKFRNEGGFHNKYSKRFSSIHKGMLEVCDVPNFKYILIHCGNDDSHTAGCLLLGDSQEKILIKNQMGL